MGDRDAFRLIETSKEIVVYRGGWGFSLPDQHTVRVNDEDRQVSVDLPQAGGIYTLDRIEETPEEVRIYVGSGGPVAGHGYRDLPMEYPFPTIDVELDRLRGRLERAAGPAWDEERMRGAPGPSVRQQYESWAQGSDYDEKTTELRALIRQFERAGG